MDAVIKSDDNNYYNHDLTFSFRESWCGSCASTIVFPDVVFMCWSKTRSVINSAMGSDEHNTNIITKHQLHKLYLDTCIYKFGYRRAIHVSARCIINGIHFCHKLSCGINEALKFRNGQESCSPKLSVCIITY